MAIFQKNITSKMDENGLKYTSRTTLHFDIGLGWLVHEKIFTAAKLRFLIRTRATDKMLPQKAPNGPKMLPMGILHDYMSSWTTLGPFRYPRGPQNSTKMAQNSPKSPEWLKMALHDPKWPKWP